MRELSNSYHTAHGSGEPVIIATVEPERPKKRDTPWYLKVLNFLKDVWEKYVNAVEDLLSKMGLKLDDKQRRVVSAFIVVLTIAVVLTIVLFVLMLIKRVIVGSKRMNIDKQQAIVKGEEDFKNKLVEEFERGNKKITKTILEKTGALPKLKTVKAVSSDPLEGLNRNLREELVKEYNRYRGQLNIPFKEFVRETMRNAPKPPVAPVPRFEPVVESKMPERKIVPSPRRRTQILDDFDDLYPSETIRLNNTMREIAEVKRRGF